MTFPLSGGLGTFTLKSAPMLGAQEKAFRHWMTEGFFA
jgi:hypothetical protein